MSEYADLNERIEQLEEELEDSRQMIIEYQDLIAEKRYKIDELEEIIADLSMKSVDGSLHNYVANAIYRRDVLGLDDGDVLSIIHEKLQTSY